MKISLQNKQTFVQALYWMGNCAACGYAAVYLLYRGLSNTLIGVVAGGAALLSIIVQPLLVKLTESISYVTVKRVLQLLIILMAAGFACLSWMPLSSTGVMIFFLLIYMMSLCMPALITSMGMEYINQGFYFDFGFSRGMGSIAYAVCAAALGFVLNRFDPDILGYVFFVFALLLFVMICTLEDFGKGETSAGKVHKYKSKEESTKSDVEQYEKNSDSYLKILSDNHVLLFFMIGFGLANLSNVAIGTYLVNIVKALGGSNSSLGIANFIAAGSEMPVMWLFGMLMNKTSCTKLMKLSAFFFLLRIVIISTAVNLPMAYIGIALQGPAFGLFTPAAVYYVNNALKPRARVKGQVVFAMVTSGCAVCGGNFLGGVLQDIFSLKIMLYVCVVLSAIGFVTILRQPDIKNKNVDR